MSTIFDLFVERSLLGLKHHNVLKKYKKTENSLAFTYALPGKRTRAAEIFFHSHNTQELEWQIKSINANSKIDVAHVFLHDGINFFVNGEDELKEMKIGTKHIIDEFNLNNYSINDLEHFTKLSPAEREAKVKNHLGQHSINYFRIADKIRGRPYHGFQVVYPYPLRYQKGHTIRLSNLPKREYETQTTFKFSDMRNFRPNDMPLPHPTNHQKRILFW